MSNKIECGCWDSNEWPFPLNGKGYTYNPKTNIGHASCMFCGRQFDIIDGKLIIREESLDIGRIQSRTRT